MSNTLYPMMRKQQLGQHVSDNVLIPPNSVASTKQKNPSSEQTLASKPPKWFRLKTSKSKRQEEIEKLDQAIQQVNTDKEVMSTSSKRRDKEIQELRQILQEQSKGISCANIQLAGLQEKLNQALKSIKRTVNEDPLENHQDDDMPDGLDGTRTDKATLAALLKLSVTLAQEMDMYSNDLIRLATDNECEEDKEEKQIRKQIEQELDHAEVTRCAMLQQVDDLKSKTETLSNESEQQKKEIKTLLDWKVKALKSLKQNAIDSEKKKKSWFKH